MGYGLYIEEDNGSPSWSLQFKDLMQQIETGVRQPDGRDCVFLWLYATDGRPYAKYLEAPKPDLVVPMVFAQLRWDGMFGTVGGKVDPGESLLEALARETREEIAYDIPADAQLAPLSTFERNGWHIHAYRLRLPFEQLREVRNRAHLAEHADTECAGYNLVHAVDYRPDAANPRGIRAFLQNQFLASAKPELELLLEHISAEMTQESAT